MSDFSLTVLGSSPQVRVGNDGGGGGDQEPWVRPVGWRIAQVMMWALGMVVFGALIVDPDLGLLLLWNVLVPMLPLVFVLMPGLWRNVCPLGSLALLPRHLGWSRRRPIGKAWQGRLVLLGVGMLFMLIPMRHIVLNTNGPITAFALGGVGVLAIGLGFFFDWKSAWCSGMCPVHQVEKLYGSSTRHTLINAHCRRCHRCVISCPDSTVGTTPIGPVALTGSHRLAGTIMLGAFPGYIWGWFQVPSYAPGEGWSHFVQAYGYSIVPALVTLAVFLMLQRVLVSQQHWRKLHRVFAVASVSCYYWYRLPWLIGLEPAHPEAVLIDLSGYIAADMLPAFGLCMSVVVVGFFSWVMLRGDSYRGRWLKRPAFAAPEPSHS